MAAQTMERVSGEAGGTAAAPLGEAETQVDGRWKPVLGLSCELTVELPMPGFTIADLLRLDQGTVIPTGWRVGQDLPLSLNATLLGWIEFEVVARNLAVRLTELAGSGSAAEVESAAFGAGR